jgi:hypothetical protein
MLRHMILLPGNRFGITRLLARSSSRAVHDAVRGQCLDGPARLNTVRNTIQSRRCPVEHWRFATAAIKVNVNQESWTIISFMHSVPSGGNLRNKDAEGFVGGDGTDYPIVYTIISVGRSARMIVRIYTGPDGQTHFEDLPLPAEENYNIALQAGASLVFRSFPADYWSDWHTAPRRQHIFVLVGQMEIGIGDGTTRRFGPGDVVLADDLTGQGHTTRSLGVPRISATVPVVSA